MDHALRVPIAPAALHRHLAVAFAQLVITALRDRIVNCVLLVSIVLQAHLLLRVLEIALLDTIAHLDWIVNHAQLVDFVRQDHRQLLVLENVWQVISVALVLQTLWVWGLARLDFTVQLDHPTQPLSRVKPVPIVLKDPRLYLERVHARLVTIVLQELIDSYVRLVYIAKPVHLLRLVPVHVLAVFIVLWDLPLRRVRACALRDIFVPLDRRLRLNLCVWLEHFVQLVLALALHVLQDHFVLKALPRPQCVPSVRIAPQARVHL